MPRMAAERLERQKAITSPSLDGSTEERKMSACKLTDLKQSKKLKGQPNAYGRLSRIETEREREFNDTP